MIDHLSTYATDYEKTRDFYAAVFTPLGYGLQMEFSQETDGQAQRMCAFGPDGNPAFWIIETRENFTPRHMAFCAGSRNEVDAFHKAGIDADATDHGAPGLRPIYHEHYYGAFLIDPDNNNVEAVCHSPG